MTTMLRETDNRNAADVEAELRDRIRALSCRVDSLKATKDVVAARLVELYTLAKRGEDSVTIIAEDLWTLAQSLTEDTL